MADILSILRELEPHRRKEGVQKTNNVVLVKRKTDGRIYVRKRISLEAVGAYSRLKNVINRNMTRMYVDCRYRENMMQKKSRLI